MLWNTLGDKLEMCLWVLVLPVCIVCYRIAKSIREITRGSVMCCYLTANDLIYDPMNTLYNSIFSWENNFCNFPLKCFKYFGSHFDRKCKREPDKF